MTPRFEVYEDRAGRWRWRLHDEHGAIVAVGGAHDTETAARRECVEAKRAAEGALIEEVDVDPSTSQTSTDPTRWLVYKHPEEKPLTVYADGWERTSDGALLRFYTGDRAHGAERVVAAFNAGSVFGFVRGTDPDTATPPQDDRLLAFPGKDDDAVGEFARVAVAVAALRGLRSQGDAR